MKAAENGHPVAQYDLGVCYYNGKGVSQSRDEAVKWWRIAAQQGNENAKKALRDI
ncbi:MAG: sel1 repeat family protein [Bacteroidaceae bacterium]|nr:sel1 repeat family protein [Bacteroidaceae bacterium]